MTESPFAVSESGARTRAERRFTGADQLLFATLSGDKNPMHMDDEAARLTPAGARVVHGVHIALWALEALASQDHSFNDVALLQVKFSKFAVVDQEVGLEFGSAKDGSAKIDVLSGGHALATISLKRSPGLKMESGVAPAAEVLANLDRPMEPTQDEMAAFHARLDCAAPAIEFSRAFPRLSEALGAERVRGLALLSTLVGMACPGLHSIFSGFTAEIAPIGTGRPGIDVRTRSVDPRFRMIAMDFEGAGLKGAVSAFERFPPIETPLASIAAVVKPGEFAGRHALVVGGSRGLGAATAKMIVAGGGRAVITYARGAKQAEAVRDELAARYGANSCSAVQFEVDVTPEAALAPDAPFTHVYYFATPRISRPTTDVFDPADYAAFNRIYVEGFSRLVAALSQGAEISVFYPSSIFVEKRPKQMTAYAMAKAAGEVLCEDLQRAMPGLTIRAPRLPRILTDQTAVVPPVDTEDAVEVMLPLLRSETAKGK